MRKLFIKRRVLFTALPGLISVIMLIYFYSQKENEYKWISYDKNGNETEVSKEEFMKILKAGENEIESEGEDDGYSYRETEKRKSLDKAVELTPHEKYRENLNIFLNIPDENSFGDAAVNNWEFKGPQYANLRGTSTNYCGRIRDLEIEGVPSLRAAGATGGLFGTVLIFPFPMSDKDVTTLNMGAFATSPLDSSLILLGTGEPPYYTGTGMWRTTNAGGNWVNVNMSPVPGIFYEIKFQPGSGSVIHAANDQGYFKSTNGGLNWTQKISGSHVTSLDVAPLAPNIIWVTKRNDGVYKSTDWGETFVRQNSFPLTGSNFKTASISMAYSNINYVYVSASNNSQNSSGIYRTTDGGTTWQDRSWRDGGGVLQDLHWGMGDRNNCIGVCPTNPDLLLVGGGGLIRSSNGGLNYTAPGITHADMCVIKWRSNGTTVYVGNDGGIGYSTDAGVTYNSTGSVFPFIQFYDIDAGTGFGGFALCGGTQDNSIVTTTNNGTTWYVNLSGDGGFVSMDRGLSMNMIAEYNSGTHNPHYISRTTNGGVNWQGVDINPNAEGGRLRNDFLSPVWHYYTNANKVYYTTNTGTNWAQFGGNTPFSNIYGICVGKYSSPMAPVFVFVNDNSTNKIAYYNGSSWEYRSAGISNSIYISGMNPHPTNNNIFYTYTPYYSNPGEKIFRTTNRGLNWVNVSGDFPNFIVSGVVGHPTNNNIMFASTVYYGMFKTTNGGTNWFRWMNGMPSSMWVNSVNFVDSSSINGKFYVVAGTHGRGMWVRESGGDDPFTGTNNNNSNIPVRYLLGQNYPNPFNPSTKIKFDLPVSDLVSIQIFDITGRLVKEPENNKQYNAGSHEIKFNALGLSSGVYFYRITTPKFTDVKKMMLVK